MNWTGLTIGYSYYYVLPLRPIDVLMAAVIIKIVGKCNKNENGIRTVNKVKRDDVAIVAVTTIGIRLGQLASMTCIVIWMPRKRLTAGRRALTTMVQPCGFSSASEKVPSRHLLSASTSIAPSQSACHFSVRVIVIRTIQIKKKLLYQLSRNLKCD